MENPSINNSIAIKEVNQFNVLNLEISLPIQFQSNSFLFSITPHWAFPKSNATITTNYPIRKSHAPVSSHLGIDNQSLLAL